MYDFDGSGLENCMPNLLEVARKTPDLALAVILIDRAGLTAIFNCPGPFTAQLPTNEAVMSVDATLLDFLLQPENQDELRDLVLYHVLPGLYPTNVLVPGMYPTLLENTAVEVTLNPTKFNNATVLAADIEACNGLINIIDQLLTFPTPGMFHKHPCNFVGFPNAGEC